MNTTVVGIIMLLVIIVLTASKKLPIYTVFTLVPILTLFLLGYAPREIADVFTSNVNSSMTGTGLLLLFSITFFTTLSETGLFDRIVSFIVKVAKGNVYLVLFATVAVATIGALDGSLVTTYLISIPPLVPLYDRMKLDRRYLLTLVMLVCTSFIPPWSGAFMQFAAAGGIDPAAIFPKMFPVLIIHYVLTFAVCILFGMQYKKKYGKLEVSETEPEIKETAKNNPMLRPNLFWVNLGLIGALILCCIFSGVKAYVIFMVFLAIALLINYRNSKDLGVIVKKCASTYMNPMLLIVGISVLVGTMNGTGMTTGLAQAMLSLLPASLSKYLFVIVALLMVPFCAILPYQVLMALIPFIVAISTSVGLDAAVIMVPFCANICLGSGSSRYVAQTHLGVGLISDPNDNLDANMDSYVKLALPLCCVFNTVSIVIALLLGIY